MEPKNPWLKKGDGDVVTPANNNNNNNNKITSSHLLASNYVPNKLRAINAAPVSARIPAKPSPNMEKEIEKVYCGLVVGETPRSNEYSDKNGGYDYPAAVDKMKDYEKYKRQQEINQCPKTVKTIDEAKFVAGQVRKRLMDSKPESKSTVSSEKSVYTAMNGSDLKVAVEAAKRVPSIGTDMVPGARDKVGTTQHYLAVFRELLQVEHAEIHSLYARDYDNYKVKINIPPAKSTQGGKVNGGVGQFRMKGIADGRPAVKPGDTVLIRPHAPVYLPYWNEYGNGTSPVPQGNAANAYYHPRSGHVPYPQPPPPMGSPNPQTHNGYPGNPQSQTPQMVEITARVLAINRGRMMRKGNQKKDQVLISWVEDPDLHAQISRQFCTIRFVPASATHERCLTALNWLRCIDPAVARDLLFPSKSPKLPPPPAIDESNADNDTIEEREYEQLNKNQARFVQMVTTRTAHPTNETIRPPMVLAGPAGTGKTKTLLATILQILRRDQNQHKQSCDPKNTRPRILICTPSHTACDVITERLVNLLSLERHHGPNHIETGDNRAQIRKMVFRLYDATRQIESVPVRILPFTRQGGEGGKFVLPDAQELLGFTVIVCTCHDAHLLFLAGLTNSSLRRRREAFKTDMERRINDSGLKLCGTIEGCNTPHFTHLFIDEAAQATEPECLIPLSVVVDDHPEAMKAEIALCGDPRQLGPCIYSPDALDGLQRSLLERLLRLPVDTYGGGRDHLMGPNTADSRMTLDEMIEYSFQKSDYHENLSVFLNLSYRGHPSFLFMPSKLFYFDKLKSIPSTDTDDKWIKTIRNIESLSHNAYPESLPLKQMDWPLLFRGVKGKCSSVAIESSFGSNCWCNYAEATAVLQMIQEVIKAGHSTLSIGVMAPFRAQVVMIRKLLRDNNFGNVNVGMVEDYQSMERNIIILSLTRTNKTLVHADVTSGEGLFHQNKRMNVALTRADCALVVVGEPNIMRDDIAWSRWLDFCKENGLWYGEKDGETKIVS